MTVSTSKDRLQPRASPSLHPWAGASPFASPAVRPAHDGVAASRHMTLEAASQRSYGQSGSRPFAGEAVTHMTGAVVSYHPSDGDVPSRQWLGGVASRHVPAAGISRMVANGTASRPGTVREAGQPFALLPTGVYAEVGPWLYVLILLVMMALIAFVYLSQTSHVAMQAVEMQRLETKVQQLKRENSAILVEIAQYQDMSRIQREAAAMGLVEPEEREYVEVWLNQPPAAPSDSAAGGVGQMHEKTANGAVRVSGLTASAGMSLPGFWSGALQQFQSWVHGGSAPAQSQDR